MSFDKRLDRDNPNLFLDLLSMRRDAMKDSIIIIVGERRSGKSYTAIKLAEKINAKFDVEKNLFFEPIDFLKRFNELENDVIILDEASEHIDRRSWWDIQNKIFSSLLTREGFRRNVIILTFPVISDLDQRAIRLSSHLLITLGINREQQIAYSMAYRLKLFHLRGKTLPNAIQVLKFGMASKQNVEKYEGMKRAWNKKTSDQNISVLEEIANPENYEKNFSQQFYIECFRNALIDEDELRNKLLKIGYRERDVNLIVDLEYSKIMAMVNT